MPRARPARSPTAPRQSSRREAPRCASRQALLASGCCCRSRMCSSRNCCSSTVFGACVSRPARAAFSGNAMTSRIDSAPAISVTMRSRPKAMPPCGGAPYWSASSRKPNFACASSGSDVERAEYFGLHVLAMYPDRAAADLPAVQHDVVRLGARGARVGLEQVFMPVGRRGERMMHGGPAVCLRRPTRTSGNRAPTAGAIRAGQDRVRCPIFSRSAPNESFTTLALSAPKKMRSPSCAPRALEDCSERPRARGTSVSATAALRRLCSVALTLM